MIIVMMVMIDDHYGNVKSQAGMVWSGSSSVFCGATVIRFSTATISCHNNVTRTGIQFSILRRVVFWVP